MPLFPSNKHDAPDVGARAGQRPAPESGFWNALRQPALRQAPPSFRAGLGAVPQTPPRPAGAAASALLKRYRPLQTRAAGGFGSVEICLDSRLQRRVAIKRMPLASPYNRTSQETTATALAEARTASMLQHPSIVQVIDFSYDSAYAYLVMEYVDGMSLEEFLAQVDGHSLTYDEAACIADALAQALSFAHENGVLHLDIKPANVLIDRSGHVKLADFGMATLASAAGFGGARGGTIGYMAPEQLNGCEVDERSDIFSLAAVLYESLCAAAPFRAGTPADSLKNIEKGVVYPSDLLPDIPETTENALLAALSPNTADRMNSVAEFDDWFCTHLGNAREGRKSLARMIARLTSDEGDAEEAAANAKPARAWELDPAEGYLGSRDKRARRFVLGAVSGISVAAVSYALLGAMQAGGVATQAATALGIGLAAAVAPQIGSALIMAGWLMLIVNRTPLLSVLPVAILSFAAGAAWWLVWGRTRPAASTVFALACALAFASSEVTMHGEATAAAPIVAGAAAFFLAPGPAAASTGFGLVMAKLILASHAAAGGAIPFEEALRAPLTIEFAVGAAGFTGLAAAASMLLDRVWQNRLDGRGAGLTAALYVAMPVASTVLLYLAYPMVISTMPTWRVATATAFGALSSILIWLSIYLLGYRRDSAEGDRS